MRFLIDSLTNYTLVQARRKNELHIRAHQARTCIKQYSCKCIRSITELSLSEARDIIGVLQHRDVELLMYLGTPEYFKLLASDLEVGYIVEIVDVGDQRQQMLREMQTLVHESKIHELKIVVDQYLALGEQ